MEWLWTWGGKFFGYIDGDDLWSHDGKHVGRFDGDNIFGPDGAYLGEIRDGRLITNTSRRSIGRATFVRYGRRASYAKQADCMGYAMPAGYCDFADPDRSKLQSEHESKC
jgi:hypothetical protein